MIPSIDPGIGIKEDQPKPPVPRTGKSGFSQVLRKTSGSSAPGKFRTGEDARRVDDPRNRTHYGHSAEESRDDPRKRPAAAEESAPDQAASEGRGQAALDQAARTLQNPHLQPAENPDAILNDEGEGQDLAALLLNDLQAEEGLGTPEEMNPIAAQIGQAAWRIGPHGKGEQVAAESQGLVFPGSAEAELIEAGQAQRQALAFQESEEAKGKVEPVADGELADVVVLGKKAKEGKEEGVPFNDQVKLEAAQGRNELLGRLTTGGTGAEGEGAESSLQRNAFLREQLQFNGMLNKNAREVALESRHGEAPLSLAQATASQGTFDPAQLFEMPDDPAVQQRMVERVAQQARWLITNERQEVTFRLHPEHLGSLHMKIVRENGLFRIDMTVDNLSAKQLLESNLNHLRSQLGEDHPGGEFLFNVDIRQGHEQPGLFARTAPSTAAAPPQAGSLQEAAEPGVPRRVLGHGGLSIYA